MYKYTVTWNASWSQLREKEPVLPVNMLCTEEFADIAIKAAAD